MLVVKVDGLVAFIEDREATEKIECGVSGMVGETENGCCECGGIGERSEPVVDGEYMVEGSC